MKRRVFLASGAAATLAAPRISAAQNQRVLKFVPQADLAVLDTVWTTAYVTRNHSFMVFDTLYGIDGSYKAQPQMVDGHVVDSDGKKWTLTLRDGLKFHDGSKVLASDCVASIKRWGARDGFGQLLMASTDELSAPDDKTIVFRLKKPFALLPDALGKVASPPVMMPERLAKTDAFTQITEMVGSGPFKFNAAERVPGAKVVYERFADYVPRPSGTPSWTSGPKVVNFDRVEWLTIPDSGTAAAALQSGEIDWWENPTADLQPLLAKAAGVKLKVTDPTGQIGTMRFNQLNPPFDNPAIRRAVLSAVSQTDFELAVAGDNPSMYHVPCGFFCPGTPMASDVGLDAFKAKPDYEAAKKAIIDAGYKGEKVVLMAPTDFPILKALADVGADVMTKCGLNVDYQALDWGTVVQRRAKKDPIDQGGWSVFHTFWGGLDHSSPPVHLFLRGNGADGFIGWPKSPKIEELRNAWLEAPDLAAQQGIAAEMQKQAFEDVPYVPLGQNFYPTGFRSDITGIMDGFVIFWNVKRA